MRCDNAGPATDMCKNVSDQDAGTRPIELGSPDGNLHINASLLRNPQPKDIMSGTVPLWWRRAPGVRGITRHFLVNHISWRAFEYGIGVSPRKVNLIFACQTAWRQLRPFPSDWALRDDAALAALSEF